MELSTGFSVQIGAGRKITGWTRCSHALGEQTRTPPGTTAGEVKAGETLECPGPQERGRKPPPLSQRGPLR